MAAWAIGEVAYHHLRRTRFLTLSGHIVSATLRTMLNAADTTKKRTRMRKIPRTAYFALRSASRRPLSSASWA